MDKAITKAQTGSNTYLNAVGRVPLLTSEQEITLGRKVQRMEELLALGRDLDPQEEREVKAGKRALDRFVRANLRLVVMVAKKYHRVASSMDFMDLVQEGNTGLIHGVRKFDPTRGYKFSTYAFWWIRQAMVRAIRYKDRMIRLPGNVGEMAYTWTPKVEEMQRELGRVPTREELAERFSVTPEDIDLFRDRGQAVVSLDRVLLDGEGSALVDNIEDPNTPSSDETMERAFYGELSGALQFLEERERSMIIKRLGLDGGPVHTLAELGREFGVSRERVRQVISTSLRKVRRKLVLSGEMRG